MCVKSDFFKNRFYASCIEKYRSIHVRYNTFALVSRTTYYFTSSKFDKSQMKSVKKKKNCPHSVRKLPILRTQACGNSGFVLKNIVRYTCERLSSTRVFVTFASLDRQTHARLRIIFLALVSKCTIL